MKSVVLLVLASLVLCLPLLADGRVLALCSTNDGVYAISVTEYLGLPKSNTRLYAAIKDQDGNYISAFYAQVLTGENNRYGGVKYVDLATGGAEFSLTAPAPDKKGFRIEGNLVAINGTKLFDGDMQCSAFNRQLPWR